MVADIYCNACETRLGWKYLEAFEESQKYKEGKFILEKAMIMKETELKMREEIISESVQPGSFLASESSDDDHGDHSAGSP